MKVTLANDVLAYQGLYAGYYKPLPIVNGTLTFVKVGCAIRYYEGHDPNTWSIGPSYSLGNGSFHIRAEDNFEGLTDVRNQWKYWWYGSLNITGPEDNFTGSWNITGPNDVIIQCFLDSMFFYLEL